MLNSQTERGEGGGEYVCVREIMGRGARYNKRGKTINSPNVLAQLDKLTGRFIAGRDKRARVSRKIIKIILLILLPAAAAGRAICCSCVRDFSLKHDLPILVE